VVLAYLHRELTDWLSGYICIALPGDRLEQLKLPMMVPQNQERHRTAYTITVDYKHGTPLASSSPRRAKFPLSQEYLQVSPLLIGVARPALSLRLLQ
jgi:hypothetical protein